MVLSHPYKIYKSRGCVVIKVTTQPHVLTAQFAYGGGNVIHAALCYSRRLFILNKNTILSIIAGIVLILFLSIMMSVKEDVEEISQMILLMLATYISYLGYTKFYRRFTS